MANFVIKKDGIKVPFDREKVKASIMAACQDAELPQEEQETITQKVSDVLMEALEGKAEVSSTQMQQMILSELDASYPHVAEAWRKYEASKGE